MGDLKVFHIKIQRLNEIHEYDLKEPLWIDDQAIMRQCTNNQQGIIDTQELWLRRLEAATGVSMTELRRLPHWIFRALMEKWTDLFDINLGTFLSDLETKGKKKSKNSISQKRG